jgi:hypothetical protein
MRHVGWSSEPLLGSTDADGLPKIGRISITRRSHSCASHPSASCSENFVIPLDVPGRTLTIGSPANHAAKLASNWKAEGIFLTNTARKVAGFEEVDEGTEGTSPLTPEEIKKCQDEAKLDVKRDDIVKEWRQDNEKNPIGSFVFSRPTPPLNQGGLRLTRTLRATSCRLLEIRPPFSIG